MYSENCIEEMLKGGIAELLVEQMFLVSGRRIQRFGFEWKVQWLNRNGSGYNGDRTDPVVKKLKLMPDFLLETKNGTMEFIEVKYRQQGRFTEDDLILLRELHDQWSPTVILASYNPKYKKRAFQVIRPNASGYALDSDRNPIDTKGMLEFVDEWAISEDAYNECRRHMGIYLRYISKEVRDSFKR